MSWNSAIYRGEVVHVRHRPRVHRLRYRVFALDLDLDELPRLSKALRFFGYNRPALFSFRDSDHGDGIAGGLRSWVDARIAEAGFDPASMRVSVLCYPRILGYVFNPLSVYFCRDESGAVQLVLYEVCNTFNERHTYVIPASDTGRPSIRHSCDKALYVSPFLSMDCRYDFRIAPPGDEVMVSISESEAREKVLFASFSGKRQTLTDGALIRLFFSHPLMTLKVTGAIHFEALRLWLKGVPFHRHRPADTPVAKTLVAPNPKVQQHEPH